jgi:hypothetical protein
MILKLIWSEYYSVELLNDVFLSFLSLLNDVDNPMDMDF